MRGHSIRLIFALLLLLPLSAGAADRQQILSQKYNRNLKEEIRAPLRECFGVARWRAGPIPTFGLAVRF